MIPSTPPSGPGAGNCCLSQDHCHAFPGDYGQENATRDTHMKHTSQNEFGRAMSAAPDVLERGLDKWALLQHLTDAAEAFDLSHRTLSVLKALLTFLPTRHIPTGPAAVVFPANQTLSHRLSGMPESTLRRHLSLLIKAGIVSRQDSPNRKRFARHRAGKIAVAYGFDLSPLAQMAPRLEAEASAAKDAQAALAVMRCRLMDIRALVLETSGESPLTIEAARLLRRKPDAEALTKMIQWLTMALDTEDMSGNDIENERHIQDDLNYSPRPDTEKKDAGISVAQTLERCTSWQTYFTEKPSSWSDLIHISDQIAPMIGIAPDTIDTAKQVMERRSLSVVILCMLERFDRIESACSYLQMVIQQVRVGSFRLDTFLRGSNQRNCQLTI